MHFSQRCSSSIVISRIRFRQKPFQLSAKFFDVIVCFTNNVLCFRWMYHRCGNCVIITDQLVSFTCVFYFFSNSKSCKAFTIYLANSLPHQIQLSPRPLQIDLNVLFGSRIPTFAGQKKNNNNNKIGSIENWWWSTSPLMWRQFFIPFVFISWKYNSRNSSNEKS